MMKVTLLSQTPEPYKLCGEAAAICTNSPNPTNAFNHALKSGHTSILEHAVFTFKIEGLSRVALFQLTRHRLASFDVQSQRYVRLPKVDALNFEDLLVMPDSIKKSSLYSEAANMIDDLLYMYQRMVQAGVPREDARYIVPQAITTELIMTMNARELLHFFSLRTCNRAQWEIRSLADEMLRICKRYAPEIFKNAGPACVTGTCREKHPCVHPRKGDFNESINKTV